MRRSKKKSKAKEEEAAAAAAAAAASAAAAANTEVKVSASACQPQYLKMQGRFCFIFCRDWKHDRQGSNAWQASSLG